jgi:hypothetical protein
MLFHLTGYMLLLRGVACSARELVFLAIG